MAKALIMLVRLLGLAGIVLGAFVWSDHQQFLGPHIGAGFVVTIVVFVMAVIALMKKAIVPGILGVVFAFLLPVIGFMQFPLTFHSLRAIQVCTSSSPWSPLEPPRASTLLFVAQVDQIVII